LQTPVLKNAEESGSSAYLRTGVWFFNGMKSNGQFRRYASVIESMISSTDTAAANQRPIYQTLQICCDLISAKCFDVRLLDQLDDHPLAGLAYDRAGRRFNLPTMNEKAGRIFHRLVGGQQADGSFLPASPTTHPESRWYEELVLLHAVAGYAADTNDPVINQAVEKNVQYHLNEIQPDHATSEPWALLAFTQYAPLLADQMLHTLALQYPAAVTGIPLLLLRDALYGLEQLTKDH
jgi:hypothetical protein